MKIPELLAPAGNLEKLKTAVLYGADAVYLGGNAYSLRARAKNFTDAELATATDLAHNRGKKVYATVNIFAHNHDLAGIAGHLEKLADTGVDGMIIADPGIIRLARRHAPTLPVHLSTQANVTNRENARFWEDMGVKRLNLARELSFDEIDKIRQAVGCEIEIFVHGALCISYSGRCLLSAAMTGREANLGDCAQPCRYRYALMEEKRPGEFFPIEEDHHGAYVMNSRDLCLIRRLRELAAIGVDSVKIEGRMKTAYYVGAAVRCYREGLDRIAAGNQAVDDLAAELNLIGTRGHTENFFSHPPTAKDLLSDRPRQFPLSEPVGIVTAGGKRPEIEARNPFITGEEIEYLGISFSTSSHRIMTIHNRDEEKTARANPGNRVRLTLNPTPADWPPGTLLRRKMNPGA